MHRRLQGRIFLEDRAGFKLGFLHELDIHMFTQTRRAATLPRAEQFTRATQLPVHLREFEAVGGSFHRTEALVIEIAIVGNQQAVGLMLTTPDASPELV